MRIRGFREVEKRWDAEEDQRTRRKTGFDPDKRIQPRHQSEDENRNEPFDPDKRIQ